MTIDDVTKDIKTEAKSMWEDVNRETFQYSPDEDKFKKNKNNLYNGRFKNS